MRKQRSKFTRAENDKSWRAASDVDAFMRRFSGRIMWEMDGPENTDVDRMQCWCLYDRRGNNLGIVLVQTWLAGGWSIYQDLGPGDHDDTEVAIYRNRTAPDLISAMKDCIIELKSERDQRRDSGNDEQFEELQRIIDVAENAIDKAKGWPSAEELEKSSALSPEEEAHVVATGHMPED